MKVSMVATTDIGGAGRVAVRLMNGLSKTPDVDVDMIVKEKRTNNDKIKSINTQAPFFDYISRRFFSNNVPQNHVLTSMMYSGTENQYLELLQRADIIHLHWVSNFVSAESLRYLDESGKSLVWTLHDRNPMTGGCHCTYGCEKYQTDCDLCPELIENPYNITKSLLALKKKYIPKDTVIVAPSHWMADCARKSAIFRNHRIEVIPNSVELDLFRPLDKNKARRKLNINPKGKVILYCAEKPSQIHKGFKFFIEAIRHIKEHSVLKESFFSGESMILLVGDVSDVLQDIQSLQISFNNLGYINNDALLATVYAAADVTVFSSLEESFGNVIIESLSCGTPVVGFNVGGMPDIIQNEITGFVVERQNAVTLSDKIVDILSGSSYSMYCRKYAEQYLSQSLQVLRYKDLYNDVFMQNRKRISNLAINSFSMPLQTHKILSPYYFEAIQYATRLSMTESVEFVCGGSLEDKIIEYATNIIGSMKLFPQGTVAIWGAGNFATRLFDKIIQVFPQFKERFLGFFDNNKRSAVWRGFPVFTPKKIEGLKLKCIIIGSVQYEKEIYEQIRCYEQSGIQIICLKRLYMSSFFE